MIWIPEVHFVLVVLLAGLFFSGCSKTVQPPAENRTIVGGEFIERHAGVVTENLLEYDFLIGGNERKEIAFVSANCGCTRLFFNQGDIFEYSQPFRVHVQLQGTPLGKGQQDFFIKFSDNTAIVCRLTYEYIPPPFMVPEELRFFADVHEKDVIFYFPNETDVTIQDVKLPAGISWKRESSSEKKHEVRLVFKLDRSLFTDHPIGTVDVFTTSQAKPHFSLPYLVLRQ